MTGETFFFFFFVPSTRVGEVLAEFERRRKAWGVGIPDSRYEQGGGSELIHHGGNVHVMHDGLGSKSKCRKCGLPLQLGCELLNGSN